MTSDIPRYSALYSISDLHLGGAPGMQMFKHGARLGGFVRWLADAQPGVEDLALVLAGDIVDSLPSLKEGAYVDVDGAADLVRSTAKAFPEVFDGLKAFVRTKRRELVVLIGNHDIELALPEAQEAFLETIAGNDAAARGRVRFHTSGTGFRCRVGDQTVYVTHGNEADRWNHVDHEALRRAAHARSLGQRFDPDKWTPNAGTKLVVDVMNDVKRRYPFVDLLKPETGAMLPILAILDAKRVEHAYAALAAIGKRAWAQTGPGVVLGHTDGRGDPRTAEVIELFAEARERLVADDGDSRAGGTLLARARELHAKGVAPGTLVRDDLTNLGALQFFVDRARGRPVHESLRRALRDWLDSDRSFAMADEDEVCRGVLGQLGAGVDVVVTGHTHLPRWLKPKSRPGVTYLNAGTWARLIAFDDELLDDRNAVAFETVFSVLQTNRMEELDGFPVVTSSGGTRPLLLDATLAARIAPGVSGTITAELVRVTGDGRCFDPVDRTQDPRSWR